jgi:hypothetical protein
MQTADAAPVLVFDLDETILRVNSFPLWVQFVIAGRLPGLGWRRRALLSLHAQRLVLWRKLGRLSHDALRWRLLLAWQWPPPGLPLCPGVAAWRSCGHPGEFRITKARSCSGVLA